MTSIVVYTDFDGTMTNRAGRGTVFSPFYQSLLAGYIPGLTQAYKDEHTELKPQAEIQQLFIKKFGPFNNNFDYSQEDADILISAGAISFFHALLKQEKISIKIITRNRADYIQALLRYQNFSDEEINKITIKDSGYKFDIVCDSLRDLEQPAAHLYILDDDPQDFAEMWQAALGKGYQPKEISAYNQSVGQFDWNTYQKSALELLEVKANMEAPPETSPIAASSGWVAPAEATVESLADAPPNLEANDTSDVDDDETLAGPDALLQALTVENPYSERKTSSQPATTEIPEITALSPYRNAQITATSAGIGFTIGFTAGTLLVATGVFAPFGAALIGAATLGLTLGVSTGLVTGLGGYIAAVGTDPRMEAQATTKKADASPEGLRPDPMSGLGPRVDQRLTSEVPVVHFGFMFEPAPEAAVAPQQDPMSVPTNSRK